MSNCDHDDHDTPHLTKVERLWYIVTGNGDPADGLVYKVEYMRQAMERQEQQWREFRALFGKILAGVGVAVLLAIGNLLITLSHK